MSDEPLTITHPDDPDKTYTYGTRGRKPRWVMDWEVNNKDQVPVKEEPKKVVDLSKKYDLYQWTYTGETTGARRAIVAPNQIEALRVVNKVASIRVSAVELNSLWKKVPVEPDDDAALTPGVWDYDTVNDSWNKKA